MVSDAQRLKAREIGESKFKGLLADAHLDITSLRDGKRPKVVSPQARRDVVGHGMVTHRIGNIRALGLIRISKSPYVQQSKRPEDGPLKERL